jgi:hypothetical protein
MDIKPVKSYRTPRYPDKRVVLDNPELLKTIPQRWKNNARAVAALSALAAIMTAGCSPTPDRTGVIGTSPGVNDGAANSAQASKNTVNTINTERTEWVAPIFEHGDGRGSFGCVSIAPPAFLSEEEAFDVICAEAEKAGITLAAGGLTLKGVKLPKTKYNLNEDSKVDSSKKGDLVLDGYDSENKIGVEFVSLQDYDEWHAEEGMWSSVSDYDFLSAAQILRDGLGKKTQDNAVGIFYNPMPRLDEKLIFDEKTTFEEKEAILKEEAAAQLRKQVIDFLEWLKGEGII